ncbi:ABC transporter ATP-binding protein [Eoetvoesia caeni]|nr:ABC transporter ATP-binding protein [Eoetvoesiella caeni]MCI2806994.1 ABC transporter ATP-binding protein [Eoetvoesiella caeni]NYT53610.1 ABC transporter ATP-binding protein [Eoetvoesiella caeni]
MKDADSQPKPVLDVSNLTVAYDRIQVLHGVDIHVGAGQLVSLVGANGAGKTTLLKAISGLIAPTGGTVSLFGVAITSKMPDWRVGEGISQVPEGRQVFAPLSVEDNLRLGAYRRRDDKRGADLERMYELFPILKEKRRLAAGTLSGGQQQMLAIARALMARPKVLLLDEPSMGLAPLLVQEIFGVITALKNEGIPILLVEQNAQAALSIADYAYVLETGKITVEGSGAQLILDDKVQQAYLGM